MWPPDALEFLRELEENNDRDWFKARRGRYDAVLFEPAVALAQKLSHLGEIRTFRPYNDTRFHPRPPIKEHLGVAIGYGGAGGYYYELSLDGLVVAGGLYRPSRISSSATAPQSTMSAALPGSRRRSPRPSPPVSRPPSLRSSVPPAAIPSTTRASTGCA